MMRAVLLLALTVFVIQPALADSVELNLTESQRLAIYKGALERRGLQVREMKQNGVAHDLITIMRPVLATAEYFLAKPGYYTSRSERLVFETADGVTIHCGFAHIGRYDFNSPLKVQIGNCTGSPEVQKLSTWEMIGNGITASGPIKDMLVVEDVPY